MEALQRLLQTDAEPDADAFWENVATNLSAKRMRLLFVADEIPDPLERVVEFLNAQMPNVEVLAVEIKQFRGAQTQNTRSTRSGQDSYGYSGPVPVHAGLSAGTRSWTSFPMTTQGMPRLAFSTWPKSPALFSSGGCAVG